MTWKPWCSWVWELLEVVVSSGSDETWILFASAWLEQRLPPFTACPPPKTHTQVYWLLFASFQVSFSTEQRGRKTSIYVTHLSWGGIFNPLPLNMGLCSHSSAHTNCPLKAMPSSFSFRCRCTFLRSKFILSSLYVFQDAIDKTTF